MKNSRRLTPLAALGVLALSLAACSGGGSGGSTGGGGGGDAANNLTDRGPITYVQGKDNSNVVRPLVDKWNAAHKDEQVTFKEQSDKADQQHDDLVTNTSRPRTPITTWWTSTWSGRRNSRPRAGCSRSRTP